MSNNKKNTLGRLFRQVQIKNVIGFTIKAKHGVEDYKKHQNFCAFVEVVEPKTKVDTKLPTNKIKAIKLDAWHNKINEAFDKATEISNKQPFECIVLTKYLNTSIKVKVHKN